MCAQRAGVPVLEDLERDPIVENFYKATIPQLKKFGMDYAGGGIVGAAGFKNQLFYPF